MPLRVTDEDDSRTIKKKLHRKMSRNGHYQKVRRPTGLEVYNDAARILEELLERRIDDDVRVNTTRRNKSDPNRDLVRLSHEGESPKNGVARSQTMPSRYRESKDEELKKKDLDLLREVEREAKRRTAESHGSDTSMDTADDEASEQVVRRRKKSRFKRAVERLKHVFNRDQKEGLGKDSDKEARSNDSNKGDRKSKINDIFRSGGKKRRRTLKENETDITTVKEPEDPTSTRRVERQSSKDASKRSGKPFMHGAGERNENESTEPCPSAPSRPDTLSHGSGASKSSGASPGRDLSPNLASIRTVVSNDTRDGTPTSSTTGSDPLRSSRSNILDSPGEDIEYMDEDESVYGNIGGGASAPRDKHSQSQAADGGSVKFHGSKGLLDMTWLASHAANGGCHTEDVQAGNGSRDGMDDKQGSTALPAVPEEGVDGAVAAGDDLDELEEDKEEMYSLVAQKLGEMGDTIAQHLSDHEGREASPAAQQKNLEELQNMIIECLRHGGDRNSRQFDEAMTVVSETARADAYERFRNMIQASLGSQLSWNYLAFLYHTTAGVVTAVGRGSQVAAQAKEFTLQYISDSCATWLIDQGGFDSVLSDTEETDYELD